MIKQPFCNREPWLLSIQEVPEPLKPGVRLRVAHPRGEGLAPWSMVYEVRRFVSKSTNIGAKRRPLFVALHSGPGSVLLFICLKGHQKEWRLTPRQIKARKARSKKNEG